MASDLTQSDWLNVSQQKTPATTTWKVRPEVAKGWGGSVVLHTLAIVLLAILMFQSTGRQAERELTIFWEEPVVIEQFESDRLAPASAPAVAGGSHSSAATMILAETDQRPVDPRIRDDALPAPPATELTSRQLSEYVGALSGLAKQGQGEGNGSGSGAGDGFFGKSGGARTFVFVLDQSSSMEIPHKLSGTQTRFERLKKELMVFINSLNEDQSFYIIFFNRGSTPMPTKGLVPATDANKASCERWIATLVPDGETDPRSAIRKAFDLNPDLIYFLSDGELLREYQIRLLKYPPGDWRLNTFTFGNRAGQFMKVFAEKHDGTYTFIP